MDEGGESRATRPGVQHSGGKAGRTNLDERIAAKQKQGSLKSVSNGETRVTPMSYSSKSSIRRNEPASSSGSLSTPIGGDGYAAFRSDKRTNGYVAMDVASEHSYAETNYQSEPIDNESEHGCDKRSNLESGPPSIFTSHGMFNEPNIVYGTSGGYDHGYVDEGLAVAVPIDEDEDDIYYPAAIQYDPDSKPPIYKNRRVRLYACMAVILLLIIVVITVVASMNSGGDQYPTLSPSTIRESLGIYTQIAAVVGEESLNDPKSPQSMALEWIVNEDPVMLPPEAENLVQRYLLSLFYFATTKFQPWLSCNKPAEVEDASCKYQKLVKTFPNETYEEIDWIRWLSEKHECEWAGVYCNDFNQTLAIELTGQQIRGPFPVDITKLSYLQSLTLVWNEFYGLLPSELGKMRHLLNIELQYNFFSGLVPIEWYSAQALQRISLSGNILTGQIATEIGQLTSLKGVFLDVNLLNGTIPSEIGSLKYLAFTRWGSNSMKGTVPTEVGLLTNLKELWLRENMFTGVIPSELGNLQKLDDLRLNRNLFSGTIPDEIYSLSQLQRLDAMDSNLTGTISTQIGNLTNLQILRLRRNNFEGTIPSELGNIGNLKVIWLHLNNIHGTVPLEVCALRGSQGLLFIDADCRSDNPSVTPLVDCLSGCCTDCCDTYSEICLTPITR